MSHLIVTGPFNGVLSGPIEATNGTAAAPSITFLSDLDTGLYRISANLLGVTSGGSNIASWGSTGLGLGTGGVASSTMLQVVDTGTSSPRGITNDQYNTGTNSAQINLRKARGTFATPTTVVTGDLLSRLISWGYDGSNFIESGGLRFTSEGTIAATRMPSKFDIYVGTDATPTVLTSTATFSGSNGISLTALGNNSPVTITPSGNGNNIFNTTYSSGTAGINRFLSSTNVVTMRLQNSVTGVGASDGLEISIDNIPNAYFYNYENGAIIFGTNNNERARISAAGGLSIGSTTDAGVGNVLIGGTKTMKFGATSGATIGVGADTTAGDLVFTGSTTGKFIFPTNVTGTGVQIYTNGIGTASSGTGYSGAFYLTANGVTALTLDTSQNATFAGTTLKTGARLVPKVTSTATAAGTTTLTTSSTYLQIFTGSTTQNVQMPAANLDGAGYSTTFVINNQSSGALTLLRAGSDTFPGAATTFVVTAGTSYTIMSDGVSLWTAN